MTPNPVPGSSPASPAPRRRRWYLLGAYVALLLTSHLVRWLGPTPRPLHPDQVATAVAAVDGEQTLAQPVRLAYTDLRPDLRPGTSVEAPPVLVLLHGSPMASRSLMRLARALADSFRVVVPDLPGMGRSTRQVPDYSIRAHSRYLLQLLDTLAVAQAHLVGYSMGGGVALEAYDRAPARIASVTMLSAIGVQELELLGNYHLNKAVHAMQLGVLWMLQEGVPHFGYLDGVLLNTSYANNFYQSDQRPLRGVLMRYDAPMLVLHGESDLQVPVAAAREHARIVPQSRTAWFDGGHGLVFRPSERLVTTIRQFVRAAEAGTAPTRAEADPARRIAAAAPFDPTTVPPAEGLTLLLFMFLIAVATLISEDLACIGAGLLVAQGTMGFGPAVVGSFVGIFVGDMLLFLAGRHLGRPLLRQVPFRWFLDEDDLARGAAWLERSGVGVIFASRFIPGTRLPTYVAAGLLGARLWWFTFYFFIASALWTPLLVGLAAVAGREILAYLPLYQDYALFVLLGGVLLLWVGFRLVVPLFSHTGRRLLVSQWRRLTRWEFWPMGCFYPPVVLYILLLALRHRSLTVFTAANPAIEHGGFVGESKAAILTGLAGAAGEAVARFAVIEPGRDRAGRAAAVARFMEGSGLDFPVVLKPDVGERGGGVAVVRSREAVRRYLEQHPGRTIVQAFAPGDEFGIFYYRYPGQAHGHIFSVTDKRFPHVTGDGVRTLERLILDDHRAVAMAPFYLKRHNTDRYRVPEDGEAVPLVEIGTHSRGALFLDGRAVLTPALERAIDRISRRYEGFYFGRYDVRTPSLADFQQGRNFKIVELNGVTSEATHIYDPKNSLLDAYRVLFLQWRIAFEIGAANQRRGARTSTVGDLIRALRRPER